RQAALLTGRRRDAVPRGCAAARFNGEPAACGGSEAAGGGDVRGRNLGVMAILQVARLGHPALRMKAAPLPVGKVRSAVVRRLDCYDREANRVSLLAKDFFARVIQHETDHLNGIVYIDRMRDLRTLSHIAEWNKHWLGVREQND